MLASFTNQTYWYASWKREWNMAPQRIQAVGWCNNCLQNWGLLTPHHESFWDVITPICMNLCTWRCTLKVIIFSLHVGHGYPLHSFTQRYKKSNGRFHIPLELCQIRLCYFHEPFNAQVLLQISFRLGWVTWIYSC